MTTDMSLTCSFEVHAKLTRRHGIHTGLGNEIKLLAETLHQESKLRKVNGGLSEGQKPKIVVCFHCSPPYD